MPSLLSKILRLFLFSLTSLTPSSLYAASSQPPLAPFYARLQTLSAKGDLGQIIRKERVATHIPDAEAWRIAYVSSDILDRKTLSTAILVTPKRKAPKEGRPIIAWAHGTTGTAQNCGPSQVIDPAKALNQYFMTNGDSWTDYGLPAVERFIQEGYVVVATDYQGLGAGGPHQYAIATTQARDVINSIRAAGALGVSGTNKKAVIYGWSQGGGATLSASGQADYIAQKGTAFDGIELVGFVAMAPQDIAALAPPGALDDAAGEKLLHSLIDGFSDNIFNFSHLSMNLWANAQTFPNLKLTDLYTQDGAKLIDEIMRRKCVHVLSDTLKLAYQDNYKSLINPHPINALAWARAIIQGAGTNNKSSAPVMIYWGTKDTVVPPIMGKLYQARMCALGANISRVQLAGEQTHFTTPQASERLYTDWIKERFQGKPLENGCNHQQKE
jgi:pimeloyl-ACP methyl ester carboxylesterase